MLKAIKGDVDGFVASSLFEAKLANSIHDKVHITSPGLRRDEIEAVAGVCHSIYKYVDGDFVLVKKYGYDHFRDKWE